MQNHKLIGILAVLALGLIGCTTDSGANAGSTTGESKSAESKPSGPKEGWTRVDVETFTIDLPKSWKTQAMTDDEVVKSVEEQYKNDPKMQGMVNAVKQAAQNDMIKLLAFDVDNGSPTFTDNLNVIVMDHPSNVSLQQLVDANVDQLKSMASGTIDSEIVKLPAGDAGRLIWSMKQAGGLVTAFSTYITIAGGKQYTFTFTAAESRHAAFDKVAQDVMQTFDPK